MFDYYTHTFTVDPFDLDLPLCDPFQVEFHCNGEEPIADGIAILDRQGNPAPRLEASIWQLLGPNDDRLEQLCHAEWERLLAGWAEEARDAAVYRRNAARWDRGAPGAIDPLDL